MRKKRLKEMGFKTALPLVETLYKILFEGYPVNEVIDDVVLLQEPFVRSSAREKLILRKLLKEE